MTVVILSQELDPTVDAVVLALDVRNVPVFRFCRSWFPQRLTLEAELREGAWTGCLRTAQRRVELTDIRSFWYRRRSRIALSPWLEAETGAAITEAVADLLATDREAV